MEAENRSVKKWKIMLVVLLVLATSLTGFILVKRHQAKTALEAYRKELMAQGEQLDQATFRPEPTEEQRARWRVLEAAVRAAEDLDIWSPMEFVVLKNHPNLQNDHYDREWYSEESLAELQNKFDQMAEAYSKLLTALEGGPLPLGPGDEKHQAAGLQVGYLVQLHLILAFNAEDLPAAFADLKALIHLAQSAAQLPFPRSHFIETALGPVSEAIRESTAAGLFGVHELKAIQAMLMNLDLVGHLPVREREFRTGSIADIQTAGGSLAEFDQVLPNWRSYGDVEWRKPANLQELPRSVRWLLNDVGKWLHCRFSRARFFAYSKFEIELRNLKNFQLHLGMLEEVALGEPVLPATRKWIPKGGFEREKDFASDRLDGVSLMNNRYRGILQAETVRRLMLVAIGLEQFRLTYGRHPNTLAELTPHFLKHPIADPWTGGPLKYRPQPDGKFDLYSVGPDGNDNEGSLSISPSYRQSYRAFNPFSSGRDIVWWQFPTDEKTEMPEKADSPASMEGY